MKISVLTARINNFFNNKNIENKDGAHNIVQTKPNTVRQYNDLPSSAYSNIFNGENITFCAAGKKNASAGKKGAIASVNTPQTSAISDEDSEYLVNKQVEYNLLVEYYNKNKGKAGNIDSSKFNQYLARKILFDALDNIPMVPKEAKKILKLKFNSEEFNTFMNEPFIGKIIEHYNPGLAEVLLFAAKQKYLCYKNLNQSFFDAAEEYVKKIDPGVKVRALIGRGDEIAITAARKNIDVYDETILDCLYTAGLKYKNDEPIEAKKYSVLAEEALKDIHTDTNVQAELSFRLKQIIGWQAALKISLPKDMIRDYLYNINEKYDKVTLEKIIKLDEIYKTTREEGKAVEHLNSLLDILLSKNISKSNNRELLADIEELAKECAIFCISDIFQDIEVGAIERELSNKEFLKAIKTIIELQRLDSTTKNTFSSDFYRNVDETIKYLSSEIDEFEVDFVRNKGNDVKTQLLKELDKQLIKLDQDKIPRELHSKLLYSNYQNYSDDEKSDKLKEIFNSGECSEQFLTSLKRINPLYLTSTEKRLAQSLTQVLGNFNPEKLVEVAKILDDKKIDLDNNIVKAIFSKILNIIEDGRDTATLKSICDQLDRHKDFFENKLQAYPDILNAFTAELGQELDKFTKNEKNKTRMLLNNTLKIEQFNNYDLIGLNSIEESLSTLTSFRLGLSIIENLSEPDCLSIFKKYLDLSLDSKSLPQNLYEIKDKWSSKQKDFEKELKSKLRGISSPQRELITILYSGKKIDRSFFDNLKQQYPNDYAKIIREAMNNLCDYLNTKGLVLQLKQKNVNKEFRKSSLNQTKDNVLIDYIKNTDLKISVDMIRNAILSKLNSIGGLKLKINNIPEMGEDFSQTFEFYALESKKFGILSDKINKVCTIKPLPTVYKEGKEDFFETNKIIVMDMTRQDAAYFISINLDDTGFINGIGNMAAWQCYASLSGDQNKWPKCIKPYRNRSDFEYLAGIKYLQVEGQRTKNSNIDNDDPLRKFCEENNLNVEIRPNQLKVNEIEDKDSGYRLLGNVDENGYLKITHVYKKPSKDQPGDGTFYKIIYPKEGQN